MIETIPDALESYPALPFDNLSSASRIYRWGIVTSTIWT